MEKKYSFTIWRKMESIFEETHTYEDKTSEYISVGKQNVLSLTVEAGIGKFYYILRDGEWKKEELKKLVKSIQDA